MGEHYSSLPTKVFLLNIGLYNVYAVATTVKECCGKITPNFSEKFQQTMTDPDPDPFTSE
jgi:hypothetical protein